MLVRRLVALCAAIALLVACGEAASGDRSAADRTAPLQVGSLPPTFVPVPPADAAFEVTSSTVPRTTVPLAPDAVVGTRVSGNRVLLIGDSVLASTARRYSDDMCEALVPLGWQVELNAETGRFVEFGDEVLDTRLSAGWDTVVLLLGNNYRGDRDEFSDAMTTMVERLAPRPVVLLTVSEFTLSRVQVNEVVFELAARYTSVVVVDWAVTTAADPSLTGADDLHLTDSGRVALAAEVAAALGPAPVEPGRCLPTQFDDDSSGSVEGTTTTVGRPSRTTTTTVTIATSTTATTTSPPSTPPDSEPDPSGPPPST